MADPRRLDELVALSLELGDRGRDLAILAEGNTSARIDDESFWVKASGSSLAAAQHPDDYVAVRLAPLLETLKSGVQLDEAEVKRRLHGAAVDAGDARPPSIETFVHAACLDVGGATFVAHTHPTAGLELGRAVFDGLRAFTAAHGEPPRVVLLLSHGLFALGSSGPEAAAITAMSVKAARVRAGALAAGKLRFLPEGEAERLYGRADEQARRQRLVR